MNQLSQKLKPKRKLVKKQSSKKGSSSSIPNYSKSIKQIQPRQKISRKPKKSSIGSEGESICRKFQNYLKKALNGYCCHSMNKKQLQDFIKSVGYTNEQINRIITSIEQKMEKSIIINDNSEYSILTIYQACVDEIPEIYLKSDQYFHRFATDMWQVTKPTLQNLWQKLSVRKCQTDKLFPKQQISNIFEICGREQFNEFQFKDLLIKTFNRF